ncbi:MAG TPA: glycoside hydrolase family 3 protein [Terriglobia bacterium]|nr:glycoside hydrolase family 3 protein [Terriglobia bacterium]
MRSSRREFLAESFGMAGASLAPRALLGEAGAAATLATSAKLLAQDSRARRLTAILTLEEKVGQTAQVDQIYIRSLNDLQKYHLGSILSGGDSHPKAGNGFDAWREHYDRYQRRGMKTRPRIPILYGIDAVHGNAHVIGATVFPHNIGMGCTRNAALVKKEQRITAVEIRATGIQWAFAPCLAVPQDIRWGRTYEGLSESPGVVKELGSAAVQGLQGSGFGDPLGVLACAKHFAGDGGTAFGTGLPMGTPHGSLHYPLDQGDTRLDDAEFRRIHLQGYVAALAAGVGSVMPSYSGWNGVKCSASYTLLTEILKEEMGFKGFLISDYRAQKELPGNAKQQIETVINAGMDMVMIPDDYWNYTRLLAELVREGRVQMSRIDDAVTRILRVKFAMGLMEPNLSLLADPSLEKQFGSPEHRDVARQCARESLVLLKNERSALPLAPGTRIHVSGKNADNIGNQCGGWTVTWQGRSGAVTTGGVTIFEAIRKMGGEAMVSYSRDGSGAAGAKIAIAVIGETPYAEMMGDRASLPLDAEDLSVVQNLKRAGIPVVAVLVSGRPLFIDDLLPQVDALVAAWLPGSEGDGVADVLFGKWKPSGKLSVTWPRGSSTSLHFGDPGYQTLFPFGSGLSY